MLLEKLKKVDPGIQGLPSTDGTVWLSPGLQGRIFCSIGDDLMHKLDFDLAEHPTPDFNNIGGNSFWPGPEGGDFAFNYPHGTWTVQDGINKVCPELRIANGKATMIKNISLLNAKGNTVKLEDKREITPEDISVLTGKFGVQGVSYTSTDTFTPAESYSTEDVILNAWTLEQFWGAEGIVAFGAYDKKDATVHQVINDDFYGDPLIRIRFADGMFLFALGGPNRLQIGFKKDCTPKFIGAYDASKNMLIIRQTAVKPGVYVNIADNDQKNGAYSTEDVYSIFNGSNELKFFELETIAPMEVRDGKLIRSVLSSTTCIFRGTPEKIAELIHKHYGLNPKEIIK